MIKNNNVPPEQEGEQNMNISTMRSDFHSAVTRLVESTAPTQQAPLSVVYQVLFAIPTLGPLRLEPARSNRTLGLHKRERSVNTTLGSGAGLA